LPFPGSGELAAVEAGGWLPGGLVFSTATRSRSGRGDRPAGLGILHQQGQANPEDGPKQRPHDDQELAKTSLATWQTCATRAGQFQPALDQVLPDQPSPDHIRPVQVSADHIRPDHVPGAGHHRAHQKLAITGGPGVTRAWARGSDPGRSG
jgi:hypothetical protein